MFRASYRHGRQAISKSFALYVLKDRREKAVNRLGITVSVKLGCAVLRNRCRRRLKEAFRTFEDKLRPGYNIVIVARSASAKTEFPALCEEMRHALSETGLL